MNGKRKINTKSYKSESDSDKDKMRAVKNQAESNLAKNMNMINKVF